MPDGRLVFHLVQGNFASRPSAEFSGVWADAAEASLEAPFGKAANDRGNPEPPHRVGAFHDGCRHPAMRQFHRQLAHRLQHRPSLPVRLRRESRRPGPHAGAKVAYLVDEFVGAVTCSGYRASAPREARSAPCDAVKGGGRRRESICRRMVCEYRAR